MAQPHFAQSPVNYTPSPYNAKPLYPQSPIPKAYDAFDTGFSIAEASGGVNAANNLAKGTKAAPYMNALGSTMGVLGPLADAYGLGQGAASFTQAAMNGDPWGSQGSQGLLDGTASALGLASTLYKPLAIPAAAASVVAFGNQTAEEGGYYGTHVNANGTTEPATFANSIVDRGAAVNDSAHRVFGDNIVGDAFGAFNAAWYGTGQTMWNLGAAGVGAVNALNDLY